MKLLFKQRFFSWFDSYDIFDEAGNTVFTVEGQLAWGHRLHILDAHGVHIGTVKQVILTFLPRYEMYVGNRLIGQVVKEFTFFRPSFRMEGLGWRMDGDFFEWDYSITDAAGHNVAVIRKELWNWTDTYTIDVADPADALYALMVVLAIDAEKDSRNNN